MDGDQYGGHITCKEHPQYNSLENFTEGVEKCVDSPFWGGKAKVIFREWCKSSQHVNPTRG
jgi:hypothetical protein